ncbi:hypothetical protein PAHAL_1G211000 [Panicum hallii]|jgi:hypothetical protein|uniref:Uncharacterized protein n=1 Tax=Panicum hallii TaxID=206008 RepID=A0A2T8KW21_9POAL|nr:hypothetical protein PAHAL_1G211000 [Panicum hallii]
MAKSLLSKREKRLRTLCREIAEPFYDKKEAAKLVAQTVALEAPPLPVRGPQSQDAGSSRADSSASAMDRASATTLQAARRAITVPPVLRLGGWTMHTTRHGSFGSPGS